jgi:predicted GH43/DUF377 family glycosyl hydrolase
VVLWEHLKRTIVWKGGLGNMEIQASKYAGNPILTPLMAEGSFEEACVYNPAAIVKDDQVNLLYRAEEGYYDKYVSRVGLAVSDDGFHFNRYNENPVIDIELGAEKRGIEDLRVIQIHGRYFLTYTAYDGINKTLCGAFSQDLIRWEKIGPLVSGQEKAGAIIQEYEWEGKYVMYFGEGELKIAFSKDLKNWEVRNEPVLRAREGYFDSLLVEGGPPPIVTDQGILLIYNSAKAEVNFRGKKDHISYSPGYAIFDRQDPAKLLFRSDKPLMEPSEYWEKYGKINYVLFVNGLVRFADKWLLYYGGADKSIGVAELSI